MNRVELTILKNLVHDDEYMRKVLPFLKEEYFTDSTDKVVFDLIQGFISKYNTIPTIEALEITLQNSKVNEAQYSDVVEILDELKIAEKSNKEWLIEETEKFCKDKAVYNAILRSISILDDKDKTHGKDSIPDLLQQALGVCFDTSVGHDYFDDADNRFDFYSKVEEKVPFDLDLMNKITNGGLSNKTLNIVLGGTGTGKTLFMCHLATSCISQGKNVLYISMEMAEERIAERIDANLLNITMKELKNMPKEAFNNRVKKISNKTNGKLIIKEYPTAGAHTGHFKALLNELSLKRSFKPDIIFIDYLNICASSRFKMGGSINSYTYIKSIAEELRGLAVEYNLPVFSATQLTRSGFNNSDVEITDTSESWGLPATCDFMIAIISTEELEQLNQLMVKQLKNRYNDPNYYKRFCIGIDRSRMKLYDVEESAQTDLVQSGNEYDEDLMSNFKPKKDFSKIKV